MVDNRRIRYIITYGAVAVYQISALGIALDNILVQINRISGEAVNGSGLPLLKVALLYIGI
ncbi:MAG: hypothetical protein HYV28_16870 [Ignavibacteriales bacterium]|nr:hypothetical protein [Ignavibacteriales bacterium]